MNTKKLLTEYGLSDKEIAVYLSLVEMGPSPVRVVASKSRVNRGTVYDILKELINQGLVSYYNKESHQYFSAESPEKLISAVEQKQNNLEAVKEKLKAQMPELRAAYDKNGGKPTMKLYEGNKGIRQILEDVLLTMEKLKDKTYFVYSSANVRKNVYESMPDFTQRRIKKSIKVKTIALGQGGVLVGLDERKWMDIGKDLQATYEIIYGGKIAHISLDRAENAIGIVIENPEIYETQKLVFEFNWKKL